MENNPAMFETTKQNYGDHGLLWWSYGNSNGYHYGYSYGNMDVGQNRRPMWDHRWESLV